MADQLSPAAWLERLERRLNHRWFSEMGVFDAYYEGDHKLAFATAKFREAFGSLFSAITDNWMPIVVDASAERLEVQGFRFGDQLDADGDAWSIWQANGLDAVSDELHTEAIKLGEAYWLVDPTIDYEGNPRAEGSDTPPRITAEHPSQMIVACSPGDRRYRLVALKKWVSENGFAYATLYLPDSILKYESAGPLARGGQTAGRINWTRRRDDPGGVNSLGLTPVIPICNSPSMLRGGRSDLDGGPIVIQNAINKELCDLLIGSEYQAYPQRVLLGVDVPRDPNTGQPLRASELQSSQSRLWAFPGKDADVKEFSAADLENFMKVIEGLVRHLTAQTRVPPHYMVGQVVNASGDALKAAETGLVKKCQRKMRPFGEGHEDTIRLAFKAMGDDKRASATDAETIWADPETRSQAEAVDAATKKQTLGVPFEQLMEDIGYSPQQIDRMLASQQADQLLAEANPPPTTNGQPPQGAVAVTDHVRALPSAG